MNLFPARDSNRGIALYYINLVTFIIFSVYAWNSRDPVFITLVAVTFLALLLQDVIWIRKTRYSPRDKRLIELITEKIKEDRSTWELLTEYDLSRNLINDRNLANLKVMREEWIGVDYEFKDRDYQAIWEEMQKDIDELLAIMGRHVRHSNAHNFSINDPDKGREANELKHRIYRAYQRFRRIFIQKMMGENR